MAERQSLRAAAKVIEEKLTRARENFATADAQLEEMTQQVRAIEAEITALEYAYEAVKPKGRAKKDPGIKNVSLHPERT